MVSLGFRKTTIRPNIGHKDTATRMQENKKGMPISRVDTRGADREIGARIRSAGDTPVLLLFLTSWSAGDTPVLLLFLTRSKGNTPIPSGPVDRS